MKKVRILHFIYFILILFLSISPAWGLEQYCGSKDAVLLQGFHWESQNYHWYQMITEKAEQIRDAGFDIVWFPPPSRSTDRQGYLPNQWYNLNSRYGSESELILAIQALKGQNTRPVYAIADIVVNHRCGTSGWGDFSDPPFASDNTTDPDEIVSANNNAICKDDEWKDNGGDPTGNNDSGNQFNPGRDLDHKNEHVQREIVQWLNWLKSDVGFAGWRWDMVIGYGGQYVGQYNDGTTPVLSVGEYWDDDRQKVINWIDATGGKSTAFDFPTRNLLRNAVISSNYFGLKTIDGKPAGMIGWWPRMSVTFIENHDTQYREDHNCEKSFPAEHIMQGYAYILTHPGKPCVFWKHFFEWNPGYHEKIKSLTAIRKEMGLHDTSTVNIHKAEYGLYAAIIDDKVAMKIGPKDWAPQGNNWTLATYGDHYAVWTKNP